MAAWGCAFVPKMESDIYGGMDPRDIPLYSIPEAAGYIHLAPATLKSWVHGRKYMRVDGAAFSPPLISLTKPELGLLSFWNLVEAYVLRTLRVEHGVQMPAVRTSLSYAQRKMRIRNLLRSREMETAAGEIFLRKYGDLVNISQSGQLAMLSLLNDQLRRVEWDPDDFMANRLFPFAGIHDDITQIMIDPRISFGRPVIQPGGITTAIIVARVDAGEEMSDIARDYRINQKAIEKVLVYERVQAA